MNQESSVPQSPPSPPQSNRSGWTWRETLIIICFIFSFIFFPLLIVGLILTWTLGTWSSRNKIIVSLIFVGLMVFYVFGQFQVGEERGKVRRDAVRRQELIQIQMAQLRYHFETNTYYASADYPLSIGEYLKETPADPLTGDPYGWINNTQDDQKYCVYANLEREGFWVIHNRGSGNLETEPLNFSDCEKAR